MVWLDIVVHLGYYKKIMQLQLVFKEYLTIQGKMPHPSLTKAPDKLEKEMLIATLRQSAIRNQINIIQTYSLLL